eukprot:1247334-Ditylum_brightwellii.AAC.1
MSNLPHAQKNPPFSWYYAWLKPRNIGKPQQDINAGMRQPDTIKVSWDQHNCAMSGRTRALSVSVVAEYNFIYMIKEKKIMVCLDDTVKDHPKRLHD